MPHSVLAAIGGLPVYTDFLTAIARLWLFYHQRRGKLTSQGQSQMIFFVSVVGSKGMFVDVCFPFSCIASLVASTSAGPLLGGGGVLSPCVPTSRVSVAFRSKPSLSPTPSRRLSFSFLSPRNYLPATYPVNTLLPSRLCHGAT